MFLRPRGLISHVRSPSSHPPRSLVSTTSDRARLRKLRMLTALSATLAAAVLSGVAVQSASAVPAAAANQVPVKHLCSAPSHRGQMACMALVRTDVKGVSAHAIHPDATPGGYGPTDL